MSEIETNKYGGRQSKLDVRFDLIPPYPLAVVAQILSRGAAKYGENNWQGITTREHLNHALAHINQFLLDTEGHSCLCEHIDYEDDLGHALCRLFFAYHVETFGVVPQHLDEKLNQELIEAFEYHVEQ